VLAGVRRGCDVARPELELKRAVALGTVCAISPCSGSFRSRAPRDVDRGHSGGVRCMLVRGPPGGVGKRPRGGLTRPDDAVPGTPTRNRVTAASPRGAPAPHWVVTFRVTASIACPRPQTYSLTVNRDVSRTGMRVADSATVMTQLVLPQHANVHGSVLGGTVMRWIDLAAAVVASRHSRRPVVTAAIDEMSFLAPIQIGQLALIHAWITLVDHSSMEIRVDVRSEDLLTGERRHTSTAYVTFVAIDPVTQRPIAVPPLMLETEDEKREHAAALVRRRGRLERRKAVQQGVSTPR